MIKITKLNKTGDTIIEVLISILILSVVLAGAYATAGRSSTTVRASQERGEALKLVEGQLERLRFSVPTEAEDGITPGEQFCFDAAGDIVEAPCLFGPNERYALSIQEVVDEGHFIAWADWERVGGANQERIEMVYRAVN